MKKVYYTQLNIISTSHEYYINIDGVDHRMSIPMSPFMIGNRNKDLKEHIYQLVKDMLKNEDFFLVPSLPQSELEAYQEDQMRHPHKYPIGDHEHSSFGGHLREES